MNSNKAFTATAAQVERNTACFGSAFPFGREQIVEAAKDSIMFRCNGHFMSHAMSICSDAQELMERGDIERARQLLNVAKVLISESSQIERNKNRAN